MSTDPRSDSELLLAHAAGDAQAFAVLFRRHRDRLWAVAIRTVGDREDAADALQEAMLSAHRAASRFRGDSAVTTWLHRIVVNACVDRLRRRASHRTVPLPGSLDEEEGRPRRQEPAAPSVDHDVAMDVRQALPQLPYEQRASLILVDLEGHSVAEVAQMLGVAEGTIKKPLLAWARETCDTFGPSAQPGELALRPTGHAYRIGRSLVSAASSQVDHDLLADYVGGALDGTPSFDQVAELVAHDPAWRHAFEQLEAALRATSLDLGRFRETPEPIPADVARRIEAALQPAPAKTPRPFISKIRWAVPVAVAAAAFAFFAYMGGLPSGMTQTTNPALKAPEVASDALASGTSPVPTITSGKQHDRQNLRDLDARTTGDTAAPAAGDGTPPPTSKGFAAQVNTPPELQRLTNPQALKVCLDAVAVVLPGKPTLVDYAYFETKPALVISITATDGEWTFVAGPNCGMGGPDEIFRAPLQ